MASERSPYAPIKSAPKVGPDGRPQSEVMTVAEVTGRLRREMREMGWLVIEGEVTGCKGANSAGHIYFNLKDEREDASIQCVMFNRQAQLGGGDHVVNGARIRLRGEAEVYASRGTLQIVVERVRPTGEGDLAQRREALKKKLAAEGLFDSSRKRALPKDPRVVGVVTSAAGAAFQDIVKVARDRGAVRILLSAAAVQGDSAPSQLRYALIRLSKVHDVDVIIIGRGGGSAEDLAAFDDEDLARAIAACPKPVVAAIGHEVDWSIACLVADVRAATPSQAAELVVPDVRGRRDRVAEGVRRLTLAMRGKLRDQASIVSRGLARLRAPERAIALHRQKVDDLEGRLRSTMHRALQTARTVRERLEHRLAQRHPREVIAKARHALVPTELRLRAVIRRALERRRALLSTSAQKLDAISPLAVLGRGYAIALVRKPGEAPRALRDAKEASVGDSLEVRLAHGTIEAEVRSMRIDDDEET